MSDAEAGYLTDEPFWFCVHTRPKQEAVTARMLRNNASIEVFSPFVKFQRPRRTGTAWVTEALFPGYLFARFSYPAQHRHVRATSGVATIVGFGGAPALVPPEIIASLRNYVSDRETVVIDPEIRPGDEVNVVEGPFCGLRAVVTRVMPARQRVGVLLEMLGMEREVEVSSAAVLPDVTHPMVERPR